MVDLLALPTVGKPWEQQLGEPDVYFSVFARWLLQSPRENLAGCEIAQTHKWAERAIAYDNYVKSQARPKDLMGRTYLALMRVAAIESEHLLDRVLAQPAGSNALSAKELKEISDLISSNKDLAMASIDIDGADYDLSKLDTADLRVLQQAHAIMRNTSRK